MGILDKARHRIRKVSPIDNVGNKINPEDFDRIISYGCSFTAGDEIADTFLLDKTFEEINVIKKTFSNQVEFYDFYNISFPNEVSYKNAWAGQLAKLINKEIVSKAFPGYSLKQTFFQIYTDYKNGFIGHRDLVLVGLTGPSRIVWYDHRKGSLDSAPITNYIEKNALSKQQQHTLLHLYDDNLIALDYFTSLNNLQELKNHMNIRLQPMKASNTISYKDFNLKQTINRNIYKFCLDIWDQASSVLLLPKVYLRDETTDPNIELCGYGHPPLQSHIELGIQIYDRCVIK